MEKLTKSANGQWRLQKVNDEVRNRRMQQVQEMQIKGQGDVKGNAGESIFNIPKEAKNFDPNIHLFHPNASDEFHRMDQDQWIDHSTKMLDDPRLNSDQLHNIELENLRRDAIINQDHDAREAAEKRQKQIARDAAKHGAQWQQQKGETEEGWKDRLIRENPRKAVEFGFLHHSVLGDSDPNKVIDFSANAIAERNQQKQENITEVQKAMLKKWQDDRNIFHHQASKFKDKLIQALARGAPETKAKVEKYLHIVPVKDSSGNVVDFSLEKKNHPKENLDQYLGIASQEPEVKQQIDEVPQAGTGVGIGRVLTPEEKQKIKNNQFPPMSPREKFEAQDRIERARKRLARERVKNEAIIREAQKYR